MRVGRFMNELVDPTLYPISAGQLHHCADIFAWNTMRRAIRAVHAEIRRLAPDTRAQVLQNLNRRLIASGDLGFDFDRLSFAGSRCWTELIGKDWPHDLTQAFDSLEAGLFDCFRSALKKLSNGTMEAIVRPAGRPDQTWRKVDGGGFELANGVAEITIHGDLAYDRFKNELRLRARDAVGVPIEQAMILYGDSASGDGAQSAQELWDLEMFGAPGLLTPEIALSSGRVVAPAAEFDRLRHDLSARIYLGILAGRLSAFRPVPVGTPGHGKPVSVDELKDIGPNLLSNEHWGQIWITSVLPGGAVENARQQTAPAQANSHGGRPEIDDGEVVDEIMGLMRRGFTLKQAADEVQRKYIGKHEDQKTWRTRIYRKVRREREKLPDA